MSTWSPFPYDVHRRSCYEALTKFSVWYHAVEWCNYGRNLGVIILTPLRKYSWLSAPSALILFFGSSVNSFCKRSNPFGSKYDCPPENEFMGKVSKIFGDPLFFHLKILVFGRDVKSGHLSSVGDPIILNILSIWSSSPWPCIIDSFLSSSPNIQPTDHISTSGP